MAFQLDPNDVQKAAKAHVDTKEVLRTQFFNFKTSTLPHALATSPNGNLMGLQSTYEELLNMLEKHVNNRIDDLQNTMLGASDDQYMQDQASKGDYPALN
ncbi:hypothetical protein [Pseudonocardia sp. HH130630-07]|uniref:hypothetical protein n=1 Tax=Pseudonocardia sp. HH130630-07 TaxID=1690815 RepID=UPI000815340F|nr:hypothetical protein [Pseudonocardia sp. HH130630-07]ANY07682.1 hypothetical protein AFB00_16820 [Pseudonocardia sp. HH130630-07]